MEINCGICQKENNSQISACKNCLQDFLKKRARVKKNCYSLYKYEKSLRQTVVAAKVQNYRISRQALITIFLENPLPTLVAKESSYIMPAPASFWSRCRGRTDLSWFLAKSLSQKLNKTFLSPPLKLCWRTKKRALEQRSMQSFDCSRFFQRQSSKPTLILIDDVVTTGFTLNKVCVALEGMYNIKILTLAYSR